MNCWYCNSYLGEPHYHHEPAPILLFCNNCPTEVEYEFGWPSQVRRVTFCCSIRDKRYVVEIEPDGDKKFSVYYTESPTPWRVRFLVFRSQSIPNINPTNVEEKVRNYLLFL